LFDWGTLPQSRGSNHWKTIQLPARLDVWELLIDDAGNMTDILSSVYLLLRASSPMSLAIFTPMKDCLQLSEACVEGAIKL